MADVERYGPVGANAAAQCAYQAHNISAMERYRYASMNWTPAGRTLPAGGSLTGARES
jgi:hypothetical protein